MPKKSVNAPLVLFVYNRPEHTERVLNCIDKLPEAKDTDLYIFSDAPKNGKATEQVYQVRDLIDRYKAVSRFASVHIEKAKQNRGLAPSVIAGVTDIIHRYGRVIVIEDDLILSNDFLHYMNETLEYYADKEKIWGISGYTFPMKALENYPHDVYMTVRGCSWGWATWADRWDSVDWEISDYSKFKFNIFKRKSFARWGKDLPTMLDCYMCGRMRSWAIRWCYSAWKQQKMVVYPKESRISNGGTDGGGTNFTSATTKYDTVLSQNKGEIELGMYPIDERIRKEFRRKYSLQGLAYLKHSLKWFLVRIGLFKFRKS